jgi:hypothetical protein
VDGGAVAELAIVEIFRGCGAARAPGDAAAVARRAVRADVEAMMRQLWRSVGVIGQPDVEMIRGDN